MVLEEHIIDVVKSAITGVIVAVSTHLVKRRMEKGGSESPKEPPTTKNDQDPDIKPFPIATEKTYQPPTLDVGKIRVSDGIMYLERPNGEVGMTGDVSPNKPRLDDIEKNDPEDTETAKKGSGRKKPMRRVQMIGRSGAGKTTNLIASYGRIKMSSEPYFEHNIRWKDKDLDRAYNLLIRSSRAPKPTTQQISRTISVWMKGGIFKNPLITVDHVDINGGTRYDEVISSNLGRMRSQLEKSEYIMVYISCRDLLPKDEQSREDIQGHLDYILMLLNERLKKDDSDGVDIVFVFTYCDLIADDPAKKEKIEGIFDRLDQKWVNGAFIQRFYVSSNPHEMIGPELPMICVIASILVKELFEMSPEAKRNPRVEKKIECARWLCEYMRDHTDNDIWKEFEAMLRWYPTTP